MIPRGAPPSHALALVAKLAVAFAILVTVDAVVRASAEERVSGQRFETMKIKLTVDGTALTATLRDNATAKDLFSLLPITLTLEDYADTEKIGYPPRKLNTAGAPGGADPAVGDLMYYAPWGNLAIFYADAPYAGGLVHLGRIDSGIEALHGRSKLSATIERVAYDK